jgi:hypothetical protein
MGKGGTGKQNYFLFLGLGGNENLAPYIANIFRASNKKRIFGVHG